MKMNKTSRLVTLIVCALIALLLVFKMQRNGPREKERARQEQQDPADPSKPQDPSKKDPSPRNDPSRPPSDNPNRPSSFDRRIAPLIFTKHARCRMGCRQIDEAEVRDILANGVINERKSEPAGRPDPKYALEGTTRDGQEVRIVFAPSSRGMVVITVIDLGKEWKCSCR